jgi:hypothetical protein
VEGDVSQLSLTGIRSFTTGDELDRCYTKPTLARAMVGALIQTYGMGFDVVVEPHVGGGNIARELRRFPDAHLVGVDVDPDADGFGVCDDGYVADWPAFAAEWCAILAGASGNHHPTLLKRPDLIAGNPPFSDDNAIPHVEASLALRPLVTAFVLPWGYWGVDRWSHLLHGPVKPAIVRPFLGRAWPDKVRECAIYEWVGDGTGGADTRIVPLPGSFGSKVGR